MAAASHVDVHCGIADFTARLSHEWMPMRMVRQALSATGVAAGGLAGVGWLFVGVWVVVGLFFSMTAAMLVMLAKMMAATATRDVGSKMRAAHTVGKRK